MTTSSINWLAVSSETSDLKKYINALGPTFFRSGMDLRFLRGTERRYVDFVILEDEKPLFTVECKAGEKAINKSLYYFIKRTKIPKFCQVHEGNRDFEKNGVRVLPVRTFCEELELP